jgi:hypothetical protein
VFPDFHLGAAIKKTSKDFVIAAQLDRSTSPRNFRPGNRNKGDILLPDKFQPGQTVTIKCQGVTLNAVVVMASLNSRALELRIGSRQELPVLRDDDGVYRSMLTEDEIEIEAAPLENNISQL